MVVFDITRKYGFCAEENIYTTIKIDADKFLFESLFFITVELVYKKTKMSLEDFEKELKRRNKKRQKQIIGDC